MQTQMQTRRVVTKGKAPIAQYREEIKRSGNTVPTARPLYVVYKFLAAELANGHEIELFNKGVGDDLQNFGYAAGSGNATRLHTNMLQNGRLPKGAHFECKGIELILPDTLPLVDARKLADCEVAWVENGGETRLVLGQFEDFPQVSGLQYGQNNTAKYPELASGAQGEVPAATHNFTPRFTGPMYSAGGKTIFDIRGNVEDSDLGFLGLKTYQAWTPSAVFFLKVKLHGIYRQVLNRGN